MDSDRDILGTNTTKIENSLSLAETTKLTQTLRSGELKY